MVHNTVWLRASETGHASITIFASDADEVKKVADKFGVSVSHYTDSEKKDRLSTRFEILNIDVEVLE